MADASITGTLLACRAGEPNALDRLYPLVYDELRRIAHRQLRRERTDHTLGTTALVHEAYLRLVDQTRVEWADRSHFFAVATQAMRRILVDYARRYRAEKRGGSQERVSLPRHTRHLPSRRDRPPRSHRIPCQHDCRAGRSARRRRCASSARAPGSCSVRRDVRCRRRSYRRRLRRARLPSRRGTAPGGPRSNCRVATARQPRVRHAGARQRRRGRRRSFQIPRPARRSRAPRNRP